MDIDIRLFIVCILGALFLFPRMIDTLEQMIDILIKNHGMKSLKPIKSSVFSTLRTFMSQAKAATTEEDEDDETSVPNTEEN